MKTTKTTKKADKSLEAVRRLAAKIAKQDLGIETLETQLLDEKDFHDLAVWNIEKALIRAYVAGRNDGKASR